MLLLSRRPVSGGHSVAEVMGSTSKRKLARRKDTTSKRKRIEHSLVARGPCISNDCNVGNGNYCALVPAQGGACIMDLPDLALQLVFEILGVGRLRAAQGTDTLEQTEM